MHPELQVELAFGIENSRAQTIDGFLSLMKGFRTPAWEPAEQHLTAERQRRERRDDSVSTKLRAIVSSELDYVYAAWNGEWRRAFEKARAVVDELEGGRELKPYQALWLYVAASAAERNALGRDVSDRLLERALACAPGLSFFVRRPSAASSADVTSEALRAVAAANIAAEITRCGGIGSKFRRHTEALEADLNSADPKSFERGLTSLGRLLGFTALERSAATQRKAIPDAVWSLEREIVIGWEAKSGDTGTGPIPIEDVRQARLHVDWIKDELKLKGTEKITVVLTGPRLHLDAEAVKFAGAFRHCSLTQVRSIAAEVVTAAARVRSETTGADDEIVRAAIEQEFGRSKLLPDQLLARFGLLAELPLPMRSED